MEQRKDEIAEIPLSTVRRTDRLVEHPVLFPMLIEVRFSSSSFQSDFCLHISACTMHVVHECVLLVVALLLCMRAPQHSVLSAQ